MQPGLDDLKYNRITEPETRFCVPHKKMNGEPEELLECIAERGGKLRVRIISGNYLRQANCQFPRNIREEGRKYRVHPSAITLIQSRGKYYYNIRSKDIEIVQDGSFSGSYEDVDAMKKQLKIYTDDTMDDCIICLENKKSIIFGPCGHLYACTACSKLVKQCPICRNDITTKIESSLFG